MPTRLTRFISVSFLIAAAGLFSGLIADARAQGAPAKLLVQSVCVFPMDNQYISIYNPNDQAVDLSNYYLTDAILKGDPSYFYIYPYIANRSAGDAGGGMYNDFHMRFPAGATIAPHDTIAVAHQSAPVFKSVYGRNPAFEVAYSNSSDPVVPDMRPAFTGSLPASRSAATLNENGESVVLYYWDGQTDDVTDVDYVVWGGDTSVYVDKTGLSIDGPDADSTPTAYKDETPAAQQIPVVVPGVGESAHLSGNALRREDFGEGSQKVTGGNGVGGRDETSEPLNVTWSYDKPAAPPFGSAVAPPAVPTAHAGGPYTGTANTAINFNGSGSTAPSGETLTHYAWNFGDGETGTGATTTHIYGTAGTYTVTLTVTASGDGTNSATTTATVAPGSSGGGVAKKLVLQTVVVAPTNNEYVAIYNPNNEAVDLSNYYISDAIHSPETSYAYIVNRTAGVAGGGTFFDFHIRFPAGATIAAHDTIAVSHQGSSRFEGVYGRKPAFEIAYPGLDDPAVPNMRPAFPGSVPSVPDSATLSNAGECVMLYYWDGASDLVTDVDYAVWGGGSGTTFFNNKTGLCVDGPDADNVCTSYKPDTPVASQAVIFAGAHANGNGFRREDFSEGTQKTSGGNGVDGRDETSENLNVTWSADKPAVPPFVKNGAPPVVQLAAHPGGPYSGTVNSAITFNGSTSTAPSGETITAYAWNFGDGGSGTGASTTHTYTAAGTFTVTLTVTASGGGTNSATTTATVATGGGGGGGGPAKKLLLQTVVVSTSPQEYIAIYNPNNEAVDLSNYYISDAIHSPETSYIYIVNRAAGVAGGGSFFDFHIRFPEGATIAAHDTIAIAHQSAPIFQGSYGRKPAFEVSYPNTNDPTVPDMRPAFPGSVPSVPDSATLSNAGECVVLYYWDGASDLVTDVDYVVWGGGSGTTFFNDKTGKCVDGPDADNICTSYKPDTPVASQAVIFSGAHANGNGFRREDFTEGTQKTTGGNGVDGRDETSENLNVTWSADKPAVPPFVKAVQPGGTLTARAGGPYSGTVGNAISFNGSSSTAPSGQTITAYAWNFGDGGSGSGATATHAYAAAGSYTVTLTVTGSGGGTNAATTTATVAAPGQLTAVPGGPYSGTVGTAITFNGGGSQPAAGQTISAYAWNFGDGGSGTGATTTHSYATAGTFTVTLTVTGSGGGTHSASTSAVITGPSQLTGALQVLARTFLPTRSEQMKITVDPARVGGNRVTLRIFDLEGREVKVLYDGDLSSKRDFSWNGRDDQLMLCPCGTYICHLEIRNDTGKVHSFTAPIVVARQLAR